MIEREGREYVLRASSGRVLGRTRSRAAILRRERQVQFFENLRKSRGGPGSLLASVSPALRARELRRRRRSRTLVARVKRLKRMVERAVRRVRRT
jgi:hypothetical protein